MRLQTCMTFVCWTQKKIFWRTLGTKQHWSSKYLLLCSADERKSHRFETTQEEWIIPKNNHASNFGTIDSSSCQII